MRTTHDEERGRFAICATCCPMLRNTTMTTTSLLRSTNATTNTTHCYIRRLILRLFILLGPVRIRLRRPQLYTSHMLFLLHTTTSYTGGTTSSTIPTYPPMATICSIDIAIVGRQHGAVANKKWDGTAGRGLDVNVRDPRKPLADGVRETSPLR